MESGFIPTVFKWLFALRSPDLTPVLLKPKR